MFNVELVGVFEPRSWREGKRVQWRDAFAVALADFYGRHQTVPEYLRPMLEGKKR